MELERLRRTWNELGHTDPFWAILSYPGKECNKWDVAEFFRTGEAEIDEIMKYVETLGVSLCRRRALDFGCGAGRLSQALCRHFQECDGVDIASSMIELARKFNRHGDRCRYHLNTAPDLMLFEDNTFDFVYCNIVLQHIPPEYSARYVVEFLRVLDWNGLAVFQLPSQPLAPATAGGDATVSAMPDSAFRAKLHITKAPRRVKPGSRFFVTVRVRNMSDSTWFGQTGAASYPVRLGHRWRNDHLEVLVRDAGRAELPRQVAPGGEVDVEIAVTAPGAEGTYHLEVDLLQELVAWFRDKGSFATQACICVEGHSAKRAEGDILVPVIEMHGVPRETVEGLVKASGGELIDVCEDDWAGPGWRGFRYCVRKAT